jgi:hypothetical protein
MIGSVIKDRRLQNMKRYKGFLAAMFGFFMMALPSIAGANITPAQSANVQPAVLETSTAQPHETLAYWYRPLACSNRHFRHHHRYECR